MIFYIKWKLLLKEYILYNKNGKFKNYMTFDEDAEK